jgi:hypothetical protein
MVLFGWDGVGRNATTIYWHLEGVTSDMGAEQRAALIDAMQAWANVVQITFQELPVANHDHSIDFNFLVGDHSVSEPQEGGDSDCPFDGPGGVLAHAAFPPGVGSQCGGILWESFAGNVHFDEAELWERDRGNASAYSLTLVACHEIGHALGLLHSDPSCTTDVMKPSTNPGEGFNGLSGNDIANIRGEYAAGAGRVVTLNETGVWVDRRNGGTEKGTKGEPFNTVAEGANGVPPLSSGVVVYIQAGGYPGAISITRDMVLRAENGEVTIGR